MIICILLLSIHVCVNVVSPHVRMYTNKEKQTKIMSRTTTVDSSHPYWPMSTVSICICRKGSISFSIPAYRDYLSWNCH